MKGSPVGGVWVAADRRDDGEAAGAAAWRRWDLTKEAVIKHEKASLFHNYSRPTAAALLTFMYLNTYSDNWIMKGSVEQIHL